MNRASGHSPRTSGPGTDGVRAARVDLVDPGRRLAGTGLAWLQDKANGALRVLGADGEVRVRLVGDVEMSHAHRQHLPLLRDITETCQGNAVPSPPSAESDTTDVLTFDLAEEPGGPLDVDILVCVDEAARQSRERGHAVERELLLYIIHGVLHCAGHDDHDEEAAARMHAEEDRILEALGVGPTYSRGSTP